MVRNLARSLITVCAALGASLPGAAHAAVVGGHTDRHQVAALTSAALVAAPKAGYQCAPYAALEKVKPGKAGTLTVRLDGYVVTYSAKGSQYFGMLSYPGSLKVTDGTRAWDLQRPDAASGEYFQMGGVCAVQLGPAPAPYVLAQGFSGGAHCCYGPTLYGYSTTAAAYEIAEDLTKPGVGKGVHWNPNGGFQPERIGSSVVLETSDGAFSYAFGCYACTPAPTRLFTVANGQLVDVTTHYPALIRSEAEGAWGSAKQAMNSASDAAFVEGPLAEWAADSCELNQGAQMWKVLEQLQAQGKLTAAERQAGTGKALFPAQLKAFLLRDGYCQGQL